MAWLTGWTYRKTITLSRASGAVSNYQMKLLVGESAGAAGENVDCNSHCQTDFDDLRFTNAAGTVLDYWIESITGTTPNQLAIVWIEFDSIGTGATTFYMYYGNAAATAVSSGANTFITFDDFERGSDGDTVGGSWTEVAAHCHISTEQDIGNVAGYTGTRAMKLIGNSSVQPMASIPVAPSANIAIRWRTYKENAAFLEILHGDGDHVVVLYAETSEQIDYYDGETKDTGKDCAADAWDLWELKTFNWTTNTFTLTFNGASVTGLTTYATASYANIVRFAAPLTTGQDVWIDDFIVRKWVATEPAWGSWGSEELGAPPDITSGPSDNGSSGTSPTNDGSNVSFSATATDTNNDSWKLLVCSTSTFPTASTTAPTCAGGSSNLWCVSSSWASSTVQNTCTFTATSSSSESNTWYAFACDNNVTPSCSTSSQGSGDTGSPFNVDHRPNMAYKIGSNYYLYRKQITATSSATAIPSAQTNFPMLVSLTTDSDLASKAQSDGDDILFTSSDGTTKLDHEIEYYASSTGQLVSWVEVPSLATSTVIYMYYGNASVSSQQNATGTWDSNFKGVWHLGDGDSTTANFYQDSTSNNNDGTLTDADGDTATTTGKMGKAMDFNGDADKIDCGSGATLKGMGDITVSLWFKTTTMATGVIAGNRNLGGSDEGWFIYIYNVNQKISFVIDTASGGSSDIASNNALSDGAWHNFVGRRSSGAMNTYVDGVVQTATGTNAYTMANEDNTFMAWVESNQIFFDGALDEISISNTARSANWITASYYNQNSPSTFYTLGSEQGYTPSDSPDPVDPGSTITFSATSSDTDTNTATDTVALLICKSDGVLGTICTGDTWCSLSSATSSNPSCTSTAVGVGSQTYYAYLFDNHNFGASTNPATSTITVNNATPSVATINVGSVSLVESSTTTATSSVTVSDSNGYADITSVTAVFYDSNATSSTCSSDVNNCYASIACSTSSCSDAQCTASCTANPWYYANASDWKWQIKATDASSASSTNTSATTTIANLIALNISEASTTYGNLNLGDTSNQATTTVENTGNTNLDVDTYGTNMTCDTGTINVGQQKFNTGAGETALTGIAQTIDLNVAKRITTPPTGSIYWKLYVPASGSKGSCSGANTFEAKNGG